MGTTGTLTVTHDRIGSVQHTNRGVLNNYPSYIAGYEGANSRVCLAHSTDGKEWTSVPTKTSFNGWTVPISRQIPTVSTVRNIWKELRGPSVATHLAIKGEAARRDVSLINGLPVHLADLSQYLASLPWRRPKLFKLALSDHGEVAEQPCGRFVRRCNRAIENATSEARVVSLWGCLLMLTLDGSIKRDGRCGRALAPQAHCLDGHRSALGRAADCNVQVVVDDRHRRLLTWYRHDFGTPGGWREIRGVQVREIHSTMVQVGLKVVPHYWAPEGRKVQFYLDRLGKLERYRRQIYSVTLTPFGKGLWLGLATVIEWAKDMSEPVDPDLPSFERDTTQIYLVTSRDATHLDLSWIYARRPLIPKGKLQRDWNSGFVLAADKIVTDLGHRESRVYFEARTQRHEERFHAPASIGMATWRLGAMVGLRAADTAAGPGVLTTKAFWMPKWATVRLRKSGLSLTLNVDARGGGVSVQLINASQDFAHPGLGHDTVLAESARTSIVGVEDSAIRVRWGDAQATSVKVEGGWLLKLRFTLTGCAQLHAFLVKYPGARRECGVIEGLQGRLECAEPS